MTKIFTLDQIKKVVNEQEIIRSIEEGFKLLAEGKVVLAPVSQLDLTNPSGMIHIKYGYIKNDEVYVIKIGSYIPENAKNNMPTINASLLIFNKQTGSLEAILLDEGYLTNVRTAAAGAVVAKYLAPTKVKRIGILGTGLQARLQLEYLKSVIDSREVTVWGRNQQSLAKYAEDLTQKGYKVKTTQASSELTKNCNLIVTTTSAREPLITLEQVIPGTHITAMGADAKGKQELDPLILQKADIVVADNKSQCIDHGEISHAVEKGILKDDNIIELGEFILNNRKRDNDSQITIADLTGVAIQDIQIAKQVYAALLEQER